MLIIGFILASSLYVIITAFDYDLFEKLCAYLANREHLELDEFLVPIFIFVSFAAINEILWRKKIEREHEKSKIYKASVWSSRQILNSCINQMTIFKEAAEATPDFNPKVLALFDDIVEDALDQADLLSRIESLDEEEIRRVILNCAQPS